MNDRINVIKPSLPDIQEYIDELLPAWENRWLSNDGAISIKYSDALRAYLDVDYLQLFGNGHMALELSFQALGLSGEVITTPYTFCSTTHAIVRSGLTPVFCDIREDNFTMNPASIESLITEKTTAIAPVHVYGFPCDIDSIAAIAQKHKLKVVYDAAHAFGVTVNGKGVASFGDISMFSTHATKVFHTVEGGIAVCHSQELLRRLKLLTNFGITSEEDIECIAPNARMNELEAAMGICNLRRVDADIDRRRMVYERYRERLDAVTGIRMIDVPVGLRWNYAYFPVIFDGFSKTRDTVQADLAKANIFARKYFYPLVNQAACYRDTYGHINLPVAAHAADHVLTLPMYADLSVDEVDRICDIILR